MTIVIDQNWSRYTADEHAIWDFLYRRQRDILKDRADPAMLRGLETLNLNRGGIPNFARDQCRAEGAHGL